MVEEFEFTEDDCSRLQLSKAWQEKPGLVEALCKFLYERDPQGIWSGSNPHALTEYLREVEMLVQHLPELADPEGLARALADIFNEMFEDETEVGGWDDLAHAMWPLISRA